MPYFVTTYSYSPDVETRLGLRPRHREWLISLGATNVLSGPTEAGTGILVFQARDLAAVHAVLDEDPFQAGGVIDSRSVVEWTPMTGRLIDDLLSLAARASNQDDMSTVELDPGARAFLELTAGAPPLDEVPVAQSRADLARVVALTGEPRPLPEVLDRTVPGPAGEVPVRVYRPSLERTLPGGGHGTAR